MFRKAVVCFRMDGGLEKDGSTQVLDLCHLLKLQCNQIQCKQKSKEV